MDVCIVDGDKSFVKLIPKQLGIGSKSRKIIEEPARHEKEVKKIRPG